MSAGKAPRSFLDANILVYADDRSDPGKQTRAVNLIAEHRRLRTGVVSLQVLQEYFVAAIRKLNLDAGIARSQIEFFLGFDVAAPAAADILAAIDLHRLHGFSYWDALVLRMAGQSGCTVLLTEDVQHGRIIDGVKIVNPFL